MRRGAGLLLTLAMLAGVSCTSSSPELIRIGAVYPLSGAQGPGGVDEFDGVRLAVQLVNADGGVGGRPVELVPVDTPSADAAPGAIAQLHDDGVRLVFGSYGSTISEPAAEASARRDMLFWETGAVGEMSGRGAGELVFRVAPSGAILGRTRSRSPRTSTPRCSTSTRRGSGMRSRSWTTRTAERWRRARSTSSRHAASTSSGSSGTTRGT
jgi:hypothetical protein